MRLTKPAVLAIAAVAALMSFAVVADDVPVFRPDPAIASLTPEQKVAAREAAMKEDGHLLQSAIKAGPKPEAVTAIDKVLQNFTSFPAWFSVDTKDNKSGADPIVWQQFDQFTALIEKDKGLILALRTAAAAGDAATFKAAVGPAAGVCGDCHQTYRS